MFAGEVELSQFSCFVLLIPQAFCSRDVLPVIITLNTSADTLPLVLLWCESGQMKQMF